MQLAVTPRRCLTRSLRSGEPARASVLPGCATNSAELIAVAEEADALMHELMRVVGRDLMMI